MRRGFTIHHNGPPAKCVGRDHGRCVAFWAAVKNYHVNTRGWSDIAYSFGVCPHGTRFEGRGWVKSQWANGDDVVGPDNGRDREWYTVLVFLGQDATVHEKPTPEMVEGVKAVIAEGRRLGRCGLEVLPHNAFKVKNCPGPEFTALAAKWNNAPLDTGSGITPPPEDDVLTNAQDLALQESVTRLRNIESTLGWFAPILKRLDATDDVVLDVATKALAITGGSPTVDDLAAALKQVFAELGEV
jgi:hypothetical protein